MVSLTPAEREWIANALADTFTPYGREFDANHTTRDQLAKALEAHTVEDYSEGELYGDDSSLLCACGFVAYGSDLYDAGHNHRAHITDALLASDAIAAVRAAAVAETTAAIEATLRDDPVFGELGGAISAAVEGLPASLPESGPPVTVERCYATGFAAPVIAAVSTHLRAALSGGRTALDTTLAQAKAAGWDEAVEAAAWCLDNGEPSASAALAYVHKNNPYRADEGADQ